MKNVAIKTIQGFFWTPYRIVRFCDLGDILDDATKYRHNSQMLTTVLILMSVEVVLYIFTIFRNMNR